MRDTTTTANQVLLNHQVGEQVEFEVHGVRHHHRIESIAPYKTA